MGLKWVRLCFWSIDEKSRIEGLSIWSKEEKEKKNNKTELPHSIDEKRRRGRIRSKISRARRKEYVIELENKVKTLEAENFRLQSVIIGYRNENMDSATGSSEPFMKEIENQK